MVISDPLSKEGFRTGKIIINSSDSATDNILTAYIIFDGDIDQTVVVKVFTETDQEYGRVKQHIKGNKGDARYIDFVFDKRTNIDGKGKITLD